METECVRVYGYTPGTLGSAVLVDRLWPRGVTKESLGEFVWYKELSPSDALRRWFHEDNELLYKEFATKYLAELVDKEETIVEMIKGFKQPVVLLTAVKEVERSHIPTLQKFLRELNT